MRIVFVIWMFEKFLCILKEKKTNKKTNKGVGSKRGLCSVADFSLVLNDWLTSGYA